MTWREEAAPRELRSGEEINGTMAEGELVDSRIIVNVPFLTWPLRRLPHGTGDALRLVLQMCEQIGLLSESRRSPMGL